MKIAQNMTGTLLAFALGIGGCGSGHTHHVPAEADSKDVSTIQEETSQDTSEPDDTTISPDEGQDPLDVGPPSVPPPELCADGLPKRAFQSGGDGTLRHELAGDFTLTRLDGIPWTLSAKWTGCDTYVFIPDTIKNSQLDSASVWQRDVAELVKRSPPNVHYFFISRENTDTKVAASTQTMHERVAKELQGLSQEQSDEWWYRLHTVEEGAIQLEGWLGTVIANGIGSTGFAIDRFQRIRGVGSFADVFRHQKALEDAGAWPWEQNLAYAAYEAHYLNAEAKRELELAAVEATEVVLFDGPVIEEFEDVEITLPDAETMAGFDTFEIDIHMQCPDPTKPEFGNCGAWDYLAHLWVYTDPETRLELGRFITSYHRETRWTLDVTPMMVHLLEGGERKMRWEWAPSWNTQPTATWVKLRFSNQGKELKPSTATFLWGSKGSVVTFCRALRPHAPVI